MIYFKIGILPKFSDLDGTTFIITISDIQYSICKQEELHDPSGEANQVANLSGVILANLRKKLKGYTFSLRGHSITMRTAFGDEKQYLRDHLKLRNCLYNDIVTRSMIPGLKRDVYRYTLQEHLWA